MKEKVHINFLIILFMLNVGTGLAQTQKPDHLPQFDKRDFNFGFSLSCNRSGYKIKEAASNPDSVTVNAKSEPGFNMGILACLRLNDNVCLRFGPGLSFEERRLKYYIVGKNNTVKTGFQPIESTYLYLPVQCLLSANRTGNFKPYVMGGVFYNIDMSGNGTAYLNKITSETDYGCGMGMGCFFYLQYIKLGVELKYNEGINNILLQQNNFVTAPLESIRSRSFVLSLTFEG
jgi:Outer membrane protein beta-barrel domain